MLQFIYMSEDFKFCEMKMYGIRSDTFNMVARGTS